MILYYVLIVFFLLTPQKQDKTEIVRYYEGGGQLFDPIEEAKDTIIFSKSFLGAGKTKCAIFDSSITFLVGHWKICSKDSTLFAEGKVYADQFIGDWFVVNEEGKKRKLTFHNGHILAEHVLVNNSWEVSEIYSIYYYYRHFVTFHWVSTLVFTLVNLIGLFVESKKKKRKLKMGVGGCNISFR